MIRTKDLLGHCFKYLPVMSPPQMKYKVEIVARLEELDKLKTSIKRLMKLLRRIK